MADNELPWYEYLVMAVILAVSFLIGVIFACTGGKQRTTKEYINADRSLGVLPVSLSMYMSFTSGITLLGNIAEIHTHGVQDWLRCLSICIGYCMSAYVVMPTLYRLKLTSLFEYYQSRYRSKAARITGSLFAIIGGVLYMGSALYTPAIALAAITPIPLWGGLLLMGGVATIYTSIGGLKAVVWSDAFQGVVIMAGTLAICIIGLDVAGGVNHAWTTLQQNNRAWVTFNANPVIRMSFWSCIVGSIPTNMNVSATSIQRLCSMKSLRQAQLSIFLMMPLAVTFYVITHMTGAAIFTHYTVEEQCDPLVTGQISSPDDLLPVFVLNVLQKPVLPGLMLSLLLVGALSSVTSSMNTNAALTWKDFLEDFAFFKQMADSRRTSLLKIISFLYGCVGIGMAFAFRYFPGHALQVALSINNSVVSPLAGMLFLGVFFPWANSYGAITGAVVSFALHFTMGLGSTIINPYPVTLNSTVSGCPENTTINQDLLEEKDVTAFLKISYQWFVSMGISTCIIVGLIVSFATGADKPEQQDPRYIVPIFDKFFCCLPASCRERLWCGVDHRRLTEDSTDDIDDKSIKSGGSAGLKMDSTHRPQHDGNEAGTYTPYYTGTEAGTHVTAAVKHRKTSSKLQTSPLSSTEKVGYSNSGFEIDHQIYL